MRYRGWFAGAFIVSMSVCGAGRWAQADALNGVAKDLAKHAAALPDRTVAVLPFSYPAGTYSSGSYLLSERLITFLARTASVHVVERSRLADLMAEMKLELSGSTVRLSTAPWTKMLAVDAIITGTLQDLSASRTELEARLIELHSGHVLAASSVRVKRTWSDSPSRGMAPPGPEVDLGGDQDGTFGVSVTDLLTDPIDNSGQPLPGIGTLLRSSQMPPHIRGVIRRDYMLSSDNQVRAQALYTLGIVCERESRSRDAALAYHRLISEFPQESRLVNDAVGRLLALQIASR